MRSRIEYTVDSSTRNPNRGLGIKLPFNTHNVFTINYTTKDQVKSNLTNYMLTNKGERPFNPEFGADLGTALFEGINENIIDTITDLINTNVEIFVPEVQIRDVVVDINTPDNNAVSVTVNYKLRTSGTSDQITVQFL